MKLSFSTLGCPNWDFDTIIRKAVEFGFRGLEIRGIGESLDVTRLPVFTSEAETTRQKLEAAALEIVCFSSSVRMSESETEKKAAYLEELKRYTQLCQQFSTPYIRIFGGKIGRLSWPQAINAAAKTLFKMLEIIKDSKVTILIETHDDWMKAEHFRNLMQIVNSEQVGLLWDINHPFMFIREDPTTTWSQAGQWIRHTHWKDSIRTQAVAHGFKPCLMGEGVVPHKQIYCRLKNGNYRGYFCLEWEKRWHPDIAEPEVAFPQYVYYMRKLSEMPVDG